MSTLKGRSMELLCCWRLLVKVDAWLALSPASSLSQSFDGVCHNTMALCQCHSLTTMLLCATDCCLQAAVC